MKPVTYTIKESEELWFPITDGKRMHEITKGHETTKSNILLSTSWRILDKLDELEEGITS